MFELANIYDEKISFKRYEGIRKNQILAHKYYLLLAKKKFIFGEIQVAEFYLNKIKRGIDIKKNKKLYLQYMERARKNKNFDIIDQMNFPRDLTIALKEKYSKLLANIEK